MVKRVVLHIGLPKTATSTMQEHLFWKLHKRGKINYLGRRAEDTDVGFFDVFYSLKKQKILTSDMKSKLNSMLSDELVNVYSEEQLSLFVNDNFQQVLPLIVEALGDCEIEFLVSFRELSEFFYSYYVEMYRWRYCSDRYNDSIGKFYENYLNDASGKDYEIFDFRNIIERLSSFGSKVNIVFYEDLINGENVFFEDISKLLNVEVPSVKSAFSFNENIRNETVTQKSSESVNLINYIGRHTRFIRGSKVYKLFFLGSKFELISLNTYLRIKPQLSRLTISKQVGHPRLTLDMINNIRKKQTLDSNNLTPQEYERLSLYGYFE